MLAQNFNRRTNVAMDHNDGGMVSWGLDTDSL
jgi:hypothetical protein